MSFWHVFQNVNTSLWEPEDEDSCRRPHTVILESKYWYIFMAWDSFTEYLPPLPSARNQIQDAFLHNEKEKRGRAEVKGKLMSCRFTLKCRTVVMILQYIIIRCRVSNKQPSCRLLLSVAVITSKNSHWKTKKKNLWRNSILNGVSVKQQGALINLI